MKKRSLLHFIVLMCVCLTAVLIFSCPFSPEDDDDGDDPPGGDPANGVYAKLIVARNTSLIGGTFTTDTIEAIFSEYYDPCATESDLKPTSVECSDSIEDYVLVDDGDKYIYNQNPPDDPDFLILDDTYEFTVTSSSEVPDLTADIDLPSLEPTITEPKYDDDVSRSSDLIIEWNDTGSGTVIIIMMNAATSAVVVSDETDDDGSYTIPAATLLGYSTGVYYLQIERYNEETITAPGYDDRSIIRGRLMSMVNFNLTS